MAGLTRMALAGAAAAALMWSSLASAHAKLVSADPAPNATISATQPIHLQFSEALASRFSSFRLTDRAGHAVPMMSVKARNASSLDARPASQLAPGVYTVTWTAVSTEDGHKTMGHYRFTVQ